MADKKISDLTAATAPLAGTEVLPIVQSSSTKKVAVNDLTVKNVRSNATTGLLQIAGPTASTTRVMTTPDANFTVARADAAQTFTGSQSFYEIDIVGATKTYISYVDALGNLYVVRYATGGGYEALPFEIAVNSDVKVRSGNLVIGTSGKGIDFSANAHAAGMTSELLADYEEGTWTPVLYGTTTAGTQTYIWQRGTYTKIGNRVIVDFTILIGTKDAATAGSLEISGLPFTVNLNAGIPQSSFAITSNMSLAVNTYFNTASPVITTATLNLGQCGSTLVNTSASSFVGGNQIVGSVQYYV